MLGRLMQSRASADSGWRRGGGAPADASSRAAKVLDGSRSRQYWDARREPYSVATSFDCRFLVDG